MTTNVADAEDTIYVSASSLMQLIVTDGMIMFKFYKELEWLELKYELPSTYNDYEIVKNLKQ